MIKLYSLIPANYNAQYNSNTSFVTFFEKGWGIECEYTFNFYTSIKYRSFQSIRRLQFWCPLNMKKASHVP